MLEFLLALMSGLRQLPDRRSNRLDTGGRQRRNDSREDFQLAHCAYPLNIALERFYTGSKHKHSALFHFSRDPVTENLPA